MKRMQWARFLSTQRFEIKDGEVVPTKTKSSGKGKDALRTDFHIDYDRVVFCGSFRRLGRKTQVHAFAREDLIHNRLTHSVEVASVGRSIGNEVGLELYARGLLPRPFTPADVGTTVQVACLAHDMGNPPFGHVGEEAIREFFRQPENAYLLDGLSAEEINDIQTYEGNAHSLRIAVNLEMYRNSGGMRLTAASIGTLMKYPWTSSEPQNGRRKFNIYQAELPFIKKVAEELGLPEIGENHWVRHPLSYLMEAADDICYALLDLEDAVGMGILDVVDFNKIFADVIKNTNLDNLSDRQRIAKIRGVAIGLVTDAVVKSFIENYDGLMSGDFKDKYNDLIEASGNTIAEIVPAAKELAFNKVFRHKSKVMTELAAFPCLQSILSVLTPAVRAKIMKEEMSVHHKLAIELLRADNPIEKNDSLYSAYMKILDFVGGMTDNAAHDMAKGLSGISMVK